MGAVDDPRHVIDGGNLFLFEQRQKLLILSRVGTCCATANNRGGEHYRSANQSVCEAGDAGVHGRISILLCHLLDISLNRHQAVTVEASGACNDGYRNWL
jgi:hypothetical protein